MTNASHVIGESAGSWPARLPVFLVAAFACLVAACGGSESAEEARAEAQAAELASRARDAASAAAPHGATRVTGVLVVVCDTLRADHLDPYGGDVGTPNVTRLAQLGTRFESHRTQGSWTLPSMLSFMSGRWVTQDSEGLPVQQPTLAEMLSEAGFTTAAFVANAVCSPQRGFARGFDSYEAFRPEAPAVELAQAFATWRASLTDPDQRWFAWVHAMDPHAPYAPAERHLEKEPLEPRPAQVEIWRSVARRLEEHQKEALGKKFDQSVDVIMDERARYRGEVRAFDEGLGLLLDTLAARGELESTLIVFAADHGEMLWERPLYPGELDAIVESDRRTTARVQGLFATGHNGSWFHPQVWQTPLVVAGPGFARGAVGRGLSANVDVFPTVLAAAEVDAPSDLDGRSLVGVLDVTREYVFGKGQEAQAVADTLGNYWVDLPRAKSAVVDERRRSGLLFAYAPREPREQGATGVDEEAPPATARRLHRAIDAWLAAATFVPNNAVDPSARQALIDLGYLEFDPDAGVDDSDDENSDTSGEAKDGE
jgi:arylsulfatase A-like enzyme